VKKSEMGRDHQARKKRKYVKEGAALPDLSPKGKK
jgi:hypothetical protein